MVKFKDAEYLYDINLPQQTTIVVRVDGKNFSNLLKKFEPTDKDHDEAMTLSAIETIKHMSNFIIAHVQSDEISFVMSTEGFDGTQPWFGNRLQKLISVPAGLVSAYYTTLMTAAKNKLFVGTFDAKVFELSRKTLPFYLKYRIKNGYTNCISKVYSVEIGSTAFKTTPDMESALERAGIEVSERSRFGVLITKQDGIYGRISPAGIIDELPSIVDNIFEQTMSRKLDRVFNRKEEPNEVKERDYTGYYN